MVVGALVASLILAGYQDPRTENAATVIRHAVAAVEGDSATSVGARWSRHLARDSSDRLAQLGLAALAQLAYQDTVAERWYRALLLTSPVGGDGASGYAAIHLARQLGMRGQWLRGDSVAALAVEIGRALRDSALTGEALAILATVRHRTQGAAAAHPLFDAADAILPAGEWRVRALSRCGRAQVYSFAGDPRATPEATAGEELATRAGDFRTRASCRSVAAGELARRAMLDSATVVYYYLIADYRAARDRAGLAVALQWRSHLYRQVGWLAKARRDAEESIVEGEASGVRVVIPWARTTLALAALSLGDVARAAPHAAEAARLFQAQGDRYGATTARGLEGDVAAAAGEWAVAAEAYRDALARSQALGWAQTEVGLHQALTRLALREGDLSGARRELAAGDMRARAASMEGLVRSNRYLEGVLALRAGRFEEAERIFRARRKTESVVQPQWAYLNAARLAEALARQGKAAEALSELTAASQALDDWRRDLRDRELRLYALQVSEDPTDLDLGIATVVSELARVSGQGTRITTVPPVFGLIERIRARELADRLTRAVATGHDTSDRAIRSVAAVTLPALMEAIPDDSTVVLRYVTGRGGEPTTLIVATWREYTSHQLQPEDSLAPAIARFAALLESGEDAHVLGGRLGSALLGSALPILPPAIRRLVIVPDGALHRVPFDALVLPDGRFVVERYSVSYVPSATVAAALWTSGESAAPGTALVMADPRFVGEASGQATDIEVFRSAVAGRGALPRLRGSAREARAVARYSEDPTVRSRGGASETWFKNAPLRSFGVVHFATHALVDEGSITNTALALAPGDGEDGFVNAGELLSLKLAADLVVLSACRTAGGALVRGEGIQGLAAPLLIAGARSVAATWWPIGDAATVRMVDDFYRALATGLPVGDALREAKLAALRRGAPAREWAAFTIIGDPMARPTLRVPGPQLPIALIVTLTAAAGLLVYGAAMRRRRTADAG